MLIRGGKGGGFLICWPREWALIRGRMLIRMWALIRGNTIDAVQRHLIFQMILGGSVFKKQLKSVGAKIRPKE